MAFSSSILNKVAAGLGKGAVTAGKGAKVAAAVGANSLYGFSLGYGVATISSFAAHKAKKGAKKLNNKFFDGYGPKYYRTIKKTDEKVGSYIRSLDAKDKPSVKEEAWLDPDIEDLYDDDASKCIRKKYFLRAYDGFRVACHFMAVAGGKETVYPDSWDIDQQIAVNALCDYVSIDHMYPNAPTGDLEDYDIDGPTNRPIITENILEEAFSRFPLKEISKKEAEALMLEDKSHQYPEISTSYIEPTKISTSEKRKETVVDRTVGAIEGPTMKVVVSDDGKTVEIVDVEHGEIIPAFDSRNIPELADNSATGGIFATNKISLATKQFEVTDDIRREFENSFGSYLTGLKYNLSRTMTGVLICTIHSGDIFVDYMIDPNLCIGNGYNIRGWVQKSNGFLDGILVHCSEKEICTKIFAGAYNGGMYVLTPDEAMKAMSHMFTNDMIYKYIDMSAISDKIKKMTKPNFRKLGQKLSGIIGALTPETYGRFRFASYKGINDFVLISDKDVLSPFPGDMLYSASGAMITVKGDQFTITYNGNSTCHEFNYRDM